MVLHFPCPKCRQPVLTGASKCQSCNYRLMKHEIRDAKRAAAFKLLTGGLFVCGLIFFFTRGG